MVRGCAAWAQSGTSSAKAPRPRRTPSLAALRTKPKMTNGMPTKRKVTTTHRGVRMGCHDLSRCCRKSLGAGLRERGEALDIARGGRN